MLVRKATRTMVISSMVIFTEGEILYLKEKDGLFFLENEFGIGAFSSQEELDSMTRRLNSFEEEALIEELQREAFAKQKENQEQQEEYHQENSNSESDPLIEEWHKLVGAYTKAVGLLFQEIEQVNIPKDLKQENACKDLKEKKKDKNQKPMSKMDIATMSLEQLVEHIHNSL